MLRFSYISLLCALICLFIASPSYALSTEWEKTDEVSTRLITGNYGKTLDAGFHFKLADNWHTYWRTPGDGGRPLTIDVSKSENVKSIEILWPAPKRDIAFGSIETFIYDNEVVLPAIITPIDSTKPIKLNISADFAACEEICIFLHSDFVLDVSAGNKNKNDQTLIDRFKAKIPAPNGTGMEITNVRTIDNTLEISATNKDGEFTDSADVFIEESSNNFRFPKPDITISKDKKSMIFNISYETLLAGKKLDERNIKLTLVNNEKAVSLDTTIPAPIKDYNNNSLLFTLLTAFLGGLILNIMPCVLPVLSLKLMGVVKHGGSHKSHIRFSFLMSAAGIISSFIALAVIVIALKSAGNAVGWGFHFQEPLFLIFLVTVINLFAANQFGLFEINLPSFINDGIHDKLKDDTSTATGHFLTGAFATLLATPCSAPFLGTAISFALSRGMEEIVITFIFMGAGLAFPYLIFALIPGLVSKLPKPGSWMVKVRYVLGILLTATSIWLIWVLSKQLGFLSAVTLALLSLALIAMLWEAKVKSFSPSLLVISSLIALSFLIPTFMHKAEEGKIEAETIWQPFDKAKISTLVKSGKVVFVDVTADWCLTCQFNKAMVINTREVMTYLRKPHVVPMKADYTSPNENIAAYLRSFNRYGIPFNVVYGPNAQKGIMLSELLTTSAVIEALEKAEGK